MIVPINFAGGLVTARDPSTLRPGELQTTSGCEYRVGTTHIYKQPGRSKQAQPNISAAILAIHKLQYDNATDRLIAHAGGTVYESDVSLTPSFATSGLGSLDTSAVPHFSSFNNYWIMCNGVDSNYIRESGTVPTAGWTTGAWRPLGMQPPEFQPQVTLQASSGTIDFADGESGDYVNPTKVADTGTNYLDTYTNAFVDGTTASKTHTWSWATAPNLDTEGANTRMLRITHSGHASKRDFGDIPGWKLELLGLPSVDDPFHKIEVSEDNGSSWTTVFNGQCPYYKTTTVHPVASGTTLTTQLLVKATISHDTGDEGWARGRIYAIAVDDGIGSTAMSTTYAINYYFTEVYYDSDGIRHESNVSPASDDVGPFTDQYGATITLPATPFNSFSSNYAIYRTLDSELGGGWPNLYRLEEIPISETSYNDNFAKSLTEQGGKGLYDILTILYSDNSVLYIQLNDPPPLARMALPFQGCMVYMAPAERRLYYSIPTSISSKGAEQVPALYFLEFKTPRNDVVKSIAAGNNGRALLVFFETYTMLVTYLPQAADPGVFDTRVTEYVNSQRGAAGPHCTTEVDMGSGRTITVAVDALGMWATDGVSAVFEWSRNLDWAADILAKTTLSTIQLWNNPEMRRLEMHYIDATDSNNRYEYHFYYGRMVEDADGNRVPAITGPHQVSRGGGTQVGIQSKHYNTLSGNWYGWSGDASISGDVFIERKDASGDDYYTDDSLGYDASGNVHFQIKTGDFYVLGLNKPAIVTYGYPKFGSTPSTKTFTNGFSCTFYRDTTATTTTKTKTFVSGTQKKITWQAYADRYNLQITDTSTTQMPALVGYEMDVRETSEGRD